MSVYFLTKPEQKNISIALAVKMERTCGEVIIFTDPLDFYTACKLMKPGAVEYIVIDAKYLQLDMFNPYEEMKKSANPVPIVVYNDPYPAPDERAAYWVAKNITYFSPDIISKYDIEDLHPAFHLIESYVNSPEINPYITCINTPKPYFSDKQRETMLDVKEFQRKNKLSPSRMKVFECLHNNIGCPISEDDICYRMWKEVNAKRKQTLYSYIYDLRKACKNEKSLRIFIEHDSKGYYTERIFPLEDISESARNMPD